MSLQMSNAVVAEMHKLAAEMGVRLHRAGEQDRQIINRYTGPSSIVAKRETTPGADVTCDGVSTSLRTTLHFGPLVDLCAKRGLANCILEGGPRSGTRLEVSPDTDTFAQFLDPGCAGWTYKRTQRRTFDGLTVFDVASVDELFKLPIAHDNHCFGCVAGMGSS